MYDFEHHTSLSYSDTILQCVVEYLVFHPPGIIKTGMNYINNNGIANGYGWGDSVSYIIISLCSTYNLTHFHTSCTLPILCVHPCTLQVCSCTLRTFLTLCVKIQHNDNINKLWLLLVRSVSKTYRRLSCYNYCDL